MNPQIAVMPGAAVRPPDYYAHRDTVTVDFPALPADRICSRCFTPLNTHSWAAVTGVVIEDCSEAAR